MTRSPKKYTKGGIRKSNRIRLLNNPPSIKHIISAYTGLMRTACSKLDPIEVVGHDRKCLIEATYGWLGRIRNHRRDSIKKCLGDTSHKIQDIMCTCHLCNVLKKMIKKFEVVIKKKIVENTCVKVCQEALSMLAEAYNAS